MVIYFKILFMILENSQQQYHMNSSIQIDKVFILFITKKLNHITWSIMFFHTYIVIYGLNVAFCRLWNLMTFHFSFPHTITLEGRVSFPKICWTVSQHGKELNCFPSWSFVSHFSPFLVACILYLLKNQFWKLILSTYHTFLVPETSILIRFI